jgi:hypothetical protein
MLTDMPLFMWCQFSRPDGPVAGGFVVGAGSGATVALDEVDDAEDGVDGGVGDDAVAEVEDVAGAAGGEREDLEDAGFEDVVGCEEGDGVEVALHRGVVSDGAPAGVERDAPI